MFLNPIMLAGIAGIVVPLVLHLLNRARYRNVEWGAMLFLGIDNPRQYRSSRLKELSLLLVRMSIIGLLAVALARPVLSGASAGLQSQPSCTVVIIDRSASMGLDENGLVRYDAAKRAVLNTLSNLRPGDEAALIFEPEGPATQLTSDLQQLAITLSTTRPFAARADLNGALDRAAQIFARSHAAFKQIVLVCDRQAASWSDVTDTFARNWRRSLARSEGIPPRFTVIPVGTEQAGNIAVEAFAVTNPPVIKDANTEFEVRVRNYDSAPSAGLPLTVRDGTQVLYQTSLNVPAGAVSTVRFSAAFSGMGSRVLTAKIEGAGYTPDDTFDCAIQVGDPIGVLIISGDSFNEPGGSWRSEAEFLRLALSPFASAGEIGPDPASVTIVPTDAWPVLDRSKFAVVILANVPRLSALQARQLEQYVYGGGGLLVAPGNLTRADDYNRQLWRDGAGALPAELQPPVSADDLNSTELLGLQLSHPAWRFLQGWPDPLPSIGIARYFPVRTVAARAQVLARYASGGALLVEGSLGRGRVMLVTTALDGEWSSLPTSNVFLPFVQSTVRYLAAGMAPDRNMTPGQPIVETISGANSPKATLDAPQARDHAEELLRTPEGYEFRYAATSRPGRYLLRYTDDRGPQHIDFIVQQPRDESDMTSLSPDRWQRLGQLLGFEMISADSAAIARAVGESRGPHELWPALLVCVLALIVIEVALNWRWTVPEGSA